MKATPLCIHMSGLLTQLLGIFTPHRGIQREYWVREAAISRLICSGLCSTMIQVDAILRTCVSAIHLRESHHRERKRRTRECTRPSLARRQVVLVVAPTEVMIDRQRMLDRLDVHWAAHLGCTPQQLRDDQCHVVARPSQTDGTPSPWPLRRGPVALVTTGTGWVLSVPPDMVQRATMLCTSLSFDQHVADGDRPSQHWFDGGAHGNPNMKRTESDAAYVVINDLVSGIPVRGWSHYVLSYAQLRKAKMELDPHVQRLTSDQPDARDGLQRRVVRNVVEHSRNAGIQNMGDSVADR